jgi:demethylmenaquinone methyltransferase/2-methoxy-6-polyprenyl-1,4-benzoquinol methylase
MSESTRQFYDRISGLYDAIADGGERKARERGLELLAVQPGERALEIGYGTGHSIVALARAVGDSGSVDGIDISAGMQAVARKLAAAEGLADRVELSVGEVPPLPYDDDAFDVVTMSFTLELFPLEIIPRVLAELRRVLVDGGRAGFVCMATVPDGEHESVIEKTYKWMHVHFPHIVDCQPIDAERLIADGGLDIVHQERLSLFTMPVAVVVAANPSDLH